MHSEKCNWTSFCEGLKLNVEINDHPDEPSMWVEMKAEEIGLSEGIYTPINFCPQCGADLRKVEDSPECPECKSDNTIVINTAKVVCNRWYACLDCGNEFGQHVKEAE